MDGLGFALVMLVAFVLFAIWAVHWDAIRLLWKTRHMTPEAAARWLSDDALTEARESPTDSPPDEREHDQ